MSENNDQSSDTSLDLSWPVDPSIETQQHERIVFENIADQYVKGEDVLVYFSILQEVNVNEQADQIGLIRIGTTNMKKCLAYANVRFNPSSTGSIRHGTATFPAADLPATKDDFYQFCYLLNKTKSLGTSVPFQLNCEADDIDLLTNSPMAKAKADSLIDADEDDGLVVIHTKRMLTEEKLRQENRQLSEMNRRLETEKDECQTKLDVFEQKRKEQIAKLKNEIQSLDAARKLVGDELSARREAEAELRAEYEACRAQCDQYQNTITEQTNRNREFEESNGQSLAELNQTRNQLAVTSQLTKDQATQIIDFERRLLQANELTKNSNQRNALLEQHIREMRLTSEKQQLSMQAKIDDFTRLIEQREDQIRALQETNHLCKEELNTLTIEKQELLEQSKQEKALIQRLQQELEDCRENVQKDNDTLREQIEQLREQLNDQAELDAALRQSMNEIQKRCLKHQKGEVEAKRQLTGYQDMIRDLEHQIHSLKDRLAVGAEEYRNLFRKYTALEQSSMNSMEAKQEVPEQLPSTTTTTTAAAAPAATNDEREDDQEGKELELVLNNSAVPEDNGEQRSLPPANRESMSSMDVESQTCPVCNWDFPKNLTLEGKQQHVDEHFN